MNKRRAISIRTIADKRQKTDLYACKVSARFDHYSSINALLRYAHGEQLLRRRMTASNSCADA